ncbi:MAG: DUF4349 domain-containing protein [Anaerolineae bacterium]|nr:DUF4349 domain-containing protein [Anaerolineae bacterium]
MKKKAVLNLIIGALVALSLIACQPQTVIVEKEVERAVKETVVVQKEVEKIVTKVVEKEVVAELAVAATLMPATAGGPALPGGDDALAALYRANRLIIKNANLQLLVADTGTAIDRVTQIVVDTFGYILSSRSWYQETFQYATITIGVPVDQFEEAMRRLRGLAVQVLDENASGSDVTDQYVDLESRLRNLEATEARVRTFLEQAQTVEESLRVSQTLSEITAQIEEIKGQMSYLKDRAAYSTITINLSPQVPTPTPTPTPDAWSPGQTFARATGVLGGIAQNLVDAAIWIGVILGPFGVPLVLIVWGAIQISHKRSPSQ